jgi:hypothetical protein
MNPNGGVVLGGDFGNGIDFGGGEISPMTNGMNDNEDVFVAGFSIASGGG